MANRHHDTRRYLIAFWIACWMMAIIGNVRAEDGFLDPSEAFRFQATQADGAVDITFKVADGYYLYRERFAFATPASPDVRLGAPQLPTGTRHFDQTFNKEVETYRGTVPITVPVLSAPAPFDLIVTSQGCSDKGVCYPPQQHTVHVAGKALHRASAGSAIGGATQAMPHTDADTASVQRGERLYSQDYAISVLTGRSLPAIIGIFFVLGMALSLLPCSLPMIPILSSIILGEGAALTRARGLRLSMAYVLGMALVYTAFGVVAALAGQSLGAALQNAWVLGAFAILLVIFALSQLGCYELQLPSAWQSRVSAASHRVRGGKMLAVFVMGALSALVVGACMTAPLFGVLAFIAQTGNVLVGAVSLFAMAWGIGVPLLIVGMGAGTLLPRAGAWMERVKHAFGVVLLAAALWIVTPVLAQGVSMWLWAGLAALACCGLCGLARPGVPSVGGMAMTHTERAWSWLGRALGMMAGLYAVVLVLGAAGGSRDPLQPLAIYTPSEPASSALSGSVASASASAAALPFATIRTVAQLDAATASAGRPSLFFFHADWCTSCVEMERFVFSDASVQSSLRRFALLQADVTKNDADDQALLKRFGLFGPPAIVFFDAHGRELPALRVVGYQPVARFLATLDQVMASAGAATAGAAKADAAVAAVAEAAVATSQTAATDAVSAAEATPRTATWLRQAIDARRAGSAQLK